MELERSLKKAITALSVRVDDYDTKREEAMRDYERARTDKTVRPSKLVRLAWNAKHAEDEMNSNREAARTLTTLLDAVTCE